MELRDWLESEAITDFDFGAERWTERDSDKAELMAALAEEVRSNYLDRSWLERRLASMGYERLAQHVKETVLPPQGNTRTGDFGEIVGTHLLRAHRSFYVPVLRLRYKDAPNGTQRLIDIVGFKFRKPPEETVIAVCEVKTRTNSEAGIAAVAAEQLAAATQDLPLSLSFIDRRLSAEGKHALADRVSALLDPGAKYEIEQHVCAVTDIEVVHADVFKRLDDAKVDGDLNASVVLLAGLSELIDKSYEAAARPDGIKG